MIGSENSQHSGEVFVTPSESLRMNQLSKRGLYLEKFQSKESPNYQ